MEWIGTLLKSTVDQDTQSERDGDEEIYHVIFYWKYFYQPKD